MLGVGEADLLQDAAETAVSNADVLILLALLALAIWVERRGRGSSGSEE
jgi:hypothetical protein